MADIVDRADDIIEKTRSDNVREIVSKCKSPKKSCYNCGEQLEFGDLFFCDIDCRDDYEKREQRGMA